MNAAPVCVVIPTHNRRDLVTRAVDSVLGQTRPPVEVVVVDDDSRDDTLQVLESFGRRIRVLSTGSSTERAAARNLGARTGSAPLLAFLDSDDEWAPDKLERQLEAASADPDAAWMTGLAYIDGDSQPLGTFYLPPQDGAGRLGVENPFLGSPSSILVPRAAFERVGGFPEARLLQGSEDWLFLLLLRQAGVALRVVPEPLVRYRVHSNNATADPAQVERSMWAAVGWIADHGLVRGQALRRLQTRSAGVIARAHAAKGRWRQCARWTVRAVQAGAPVEAGRTSALVVATATKTITSARRP